MSGRELELSLSPCLIGKGGDDSERYETMAGERTCGGTSLAVALQQEAARGEWR
jgi:hypothetical protein